MRSEDEVKEALDRMQKHMDKYPTFVDGRMSWGLGQMVPSREVLYWVLGIGGEDHMKAWAPED